MTSAPLSFSTPLSPEFIHGAIEIERTAAGLLPHRLPGWVRERHGDAQLAMVESQPAGVRLVFQTAATTLELLTLPTKRVYRNMPPRGDGVYDLLTDGRLTHQASAPGGNALHIDMATGAVDPQPGTVQTLRFQGLATGLKTIEIWLPHDETAELVALRSDASVTPVTVPGRRRWVHHGSSISHGSNATHPSGTWPAVAAAGAAVDLVNLGFGGNALLDPFTARTIRDMRADLISMKIGINVVNTDAMRLRAFVPAVHGFLDTIRDGHPTTPLLVVSPIYCPIHEERPGPTAFDTAALAQGRLSFVASGAESDVGQGKLNLVVIRAQLQAIVRQRAKTDPHLHYLDGTRLYGASDNQRHPLPDALHPDAFTHRQMGERFTDAVFVQGPIRPAFAAKSSG
ncbi:GDSL-like lipase/acylhydrolase family protein [Pseudoduganella flava]|uniref:Lipase n=1 Tax=Pseudoduganella flava TaxID=871742 RepID=A0A562Q3P5_9BURK|nr:SGNH/GDSL hydrolase family protein [Pseudoduganella flava]QGZ41421.1 lipase [Pseudoduganella flava]TWI51375.1 GDSL-like lipase/acylhydrolase family protein [Pseudoduganella flava]